MVRLRHELILEPVPRAWFERIVALGHDTLGEYLGGPNLPLLDGAPLRPGARYASADGITEVTLESWDRNAETSGLIDIADDEIMTSCSVWLYSASAPRTVELAGRVQSITRGIGWLTTVACGLRADLERWWAGGEPAIEGRVLHALFRIPFAVTPSPGEGGRWRITLTGKLRGRGVLRPLTAVGLIIGRARIRHQVAATLDAFAERWNREVPALLATQPDELRELITAAVRSTLA